MHVVCAKDEVREFGGLDDSSARVGEGWCCHDVGVQRLMIALLADVAVQTHSGGVDNLFIVQNRNIFDLSIRWRARMIARRHECCPVPSASDGAA